MDDRLSPTQHCADGGLPYRRPSGGSGAIRRPVGRIRRKRAPIACGGAAQPPAASLLARIDRRQSAPQSSAARQGGLVLSVEREAKPVEFVAAADAGKIAWFAAASHQAAPIV